jgi:hypothetical protein
MDCGKVYGSVQEGNLTEARFLARTHATTCPVRGVKTIFSIGKLHVGWATRDDAK